MTAVYLADARVEKTESSTVVTKVAALAVLMVEKKAYEWAEKKAEILVA